MIETEIKFKIPDPAGIREKLLALGGAHQRKFFSKNILFDTPDWRLKKKGCMLRLRAEGDAAVITFKGRSMKSRFKKKKEINMHVEGQEKALQILKEIGFEEKWAYEKETEHIRFGGAEITIDRLPAAGYFMEIEGEPREIGKTAKALGFDLKEGIKETYADIFKKLKKRGKLKGKNWVFR